MKDPKILRYEGLPKRRKPDSLSVVLFIYGCGILIVTKLLEVW